MSLGKFAEYSTGKTVVSDHQSDPNLRALSDDDLHVSSQKVAEQERAVTLKLLKLLSESERRHLYSKFSCDSLHAYCVKHLKMSDPQAGRRVAAARLLHDMRVLEEKIASGTMSLTTICQASSFFRAEAKSGNTFAASEKLELVSKLDHQSKLKVEQILIAHSSSPDVHVRESVKRKTENLTEIKIIAAEKNLVACNPGNKLH